MMTALRSLFRRGFGLDAARLTKEIDELKILTARRLLEQRQDTALVDDLAAAEFKVFSQFGDDGIIQYLIRQTAIPAAGHAFIEFGVENYREANTRFLLLNDNWRGLIIDGSAAHMESVRRSDLYWRHDLTAVAAFIDRDNINTLFTANGFAGDIGLLSIDIDGNDYWVWENIDVVHPTIVIVEYNSVFGPQLAVTVPYDASFVRSRAHHSYLLWGASLQALCRLGARKGYHFVGCNSSGNNAYFVRKDRIGQLQPLEPEQGYVESRFRESRDRAGRLSFVAGAARLELMKDAAVFNLDTGSIECLATLLAPAPPGGGNVDSASNKRKAG